MHLRGSPQVNQIPEIKRLLDGVEQQGGVEVAVRIEPALDDERMASLEKQVAGLRFKRIDGRIVQTGSATYEATVPFDQLTPLAGLPEVVSVNPAPGVRSALVALGH